MKMEDYSKYYIQGSDHYLIPRDIFEELFNEMSNWRDESKQLKEVIEEVREYILNHELVEEKDHYVLNGNELLQILDKAKGEMNNE